MIRKIILTALFAALSVIAIPLTMNVQIALKDGTGAPRVLNNSPVIFKFMGNGNLEIWSETKSFTSQNGLIVTSLGDSTAIPASAVYAQDSLRLLAIMGSDTVLNEPLNSVMFSFKAGFADSAKIAGIAKVSDSARVAGTLQGKTLANLRTEIRDSIASHPVPLSDSARIADSARVAGSLQGKTLPNLRLEIRDSIAAHPAPSPASQISDTASALRSALSTSISTGIRDSLGARFNQGVKTTDNVSFASVTAPLTGSLNTNNANITTGTGDITTDSVSARAVRSALFHGQNLRAFNDTLLFLPRAWFNPLDAVSLCFGNSKSFLRNTWGGPLRLESETSMMLKANSGLGITLDASYAVLPSTYLGGLGKARIDSVQQVAGDKDTLKIYTQGSDIPFILIK